MNREWRNKELVELARQHDHIATALTEAAQELAAHRITDKQYEDWLDAMAEPVILCPYCWDWEDVEDAWIVDGRMFCCLMCALSDDRREGR